MLGTTCVACGRKRTGIQRFDKDREAMLLRHGFAPERAKRLATRIFYDHHCRERDYVEKPEPAITFTDKLEYAEEFACYQD